MLMEEKNPRIEISEDKELLFFFLFFHMFPYSS